MNILKFPYKRQLLFPLQMTSVVTKKVVCVRTDGSMRYHDSTKTYQKYREDSDFIRYIEMYGTSKIVFESSTRLPDRCDACGYGDETKQCTCDLDEKIPCSFPVSLFHLHKNSFANQAEELCEAFFSRTGDRLTSLLPSNNTHVYIYEIPSDLKYYVNEEFDVSECSYGNHNPTYRIEENEEFEYLEVLSEEYAQPKHSGY